MILRLVRSLGVAYFYLIHLRLLRAVGPRIAVRVSRVVGTLHWLATLVGVSDELGPVLRQVRPRLNTRFPVREISRRYLLWKHQRIAEWYLSDTRRGQRFIKETYAIEGREHLDAVRAAGRGAVIVSFHYGMSKLLPSALRAQGYELGQLVVRARPRGVFDWVNALVLRESVRLDEANGLHVFYHRPGALALDFFNHLRDGGLVAVLADGMNAEQFVDAEFLDGTIRLPTGPARIAAQTGAPIVFMMSVIDSLFRHRIIVHPPFKVAGRSAAAAEQAVRTYTRLFDDYVRSLPWGWYTWRRLQISCDAQGRPQFLPRVRQDDQTQYLERGPPARRPAAPAVDDPA